MRIPHRDAAIARRAAAARRSHDELNAIGAAPGTASARGGGGAHKEHTAVW